MNEKYLIINPQLHIADFDDSQNQNNKIFELKDSQGKVNRFIAPEKLLQHLKRFNSQTNITEAFALYQSTRSDGEPELDSFKNFIYHYCIPNKILVDINETSFNAPTVEDRSNYLQFKRSLLRPSVVNFTSQFLGIFYQPSIAALILISSIITGIALLTDSSSIYYAQIFKMSFKETSAFIALMTLGLLVHELGHAAAAYKYGCRNIDIGIGWYIAFFIFYANLSESWRLSRKQRTIIDIGGIYFQIIYMMFLSVLFLLYQHNYIFYSLVALSFSLLWNINPFFRMDGYWIASNMLGVPNLRKTINQHTGYWLIKILSPREKTDIPKLDLPYKYQLGLYGYLISANIFLIYFVFYLFDKLVIVTLKEIPEGYQSLMITLNTSGNYFDIFQLVLFISWRMIFLYFVGYFLFHLSKKLYVWYDMAKA